VQKFTGGYSPRRIGYQPECFEPIRDSIATRRLPSPRFCDLIGRAKNGELSAAHPLVWWWSEATTNYAPGPLEAWPRWVARLRRDCTGGRGGRFFNDFRPTNKTFDITRLQLIWRTLRAAHPWCPLSLRNEASGRHSAPTYPCPSCSDRSMHHITHLAASVM